MGAAKEPPANAQNLQQGLLERILAAVEETGSAAQPAAEELLRVVQDLRDLLASVVSSDVVQGLLALRGRRTLLRLLLGVLPTHTAAELLPGRIGRAPV